MEYTTTEQQRIVENMKEIRDHLLTIAPYIGERFETNFRGKYNYSLIIYNYHAPELSGYIGNNVSLSWDLNADERTRTVYTEFDYCVSLFENWQAIKEEINQTITDRRRKHDLIFNFRI